MIPAGPNAQPLVVIGNAYATNEYIVTPAGSWKLEDSNVQAYDQTTTTTYTPGWAIALAIIFALFFLLGLLFLLARESRTTGYVAVTFAANGQMYNENVPVYNGGARADIFNRVGYLQSLIGQARFRAQNQG